MLKADSFSWFGCQVSASSGSWIIPRGGECRRSARHPGDACLQQASSDPLWPGKSVRCGLLKLSEQQLGDRFPTLIL